MEQREEGKRATRGAVELCEADGNVHIITHYPDLQAVLIFCLVVVSPPVITVGEDTQGFIYHDQAYGI